MKSRCFLGNFTFDNTVSRYQVGLARSVGDRTNIPSSALVRFRIRVRVRIRVRLGLGLGLGIG
eukprot:178571-Amorphochlora_amoeboformis.AAC.1